MSIVLHQWLSAAKKGGYDDRIVSYVDYVQWRGDLYSWTNIAYNSHKIEDAELMIKVKESFGIMVAGSFYRYLKEVYNMKNNVHDRRKVRLEDMEDYIPFKEGRPKRDTVINNDDILNIKIALNTSRDIKQFVKAV